MLLAIETSCDECSASVVSEEKTASGQLRAKIHSNVVFSQIELHSKFGGVVPEVASRNHLEMLAPVVDEALANAKIKLSDLSAIAVTQRPGLIGALLVGVSYAKTLAYTLNLPLVGVNHLEGHLHSLFIDAQKNCEINSNNLPLLVCLISGGHTNLYLVRDLPPQSLNLEMLAESRDDAAGEAFDKSAKLLGLPYPGGQLLDEHSKTGNPKAYAFPRPLIHTDALEFSFSGLKTAVLNQLRKEGFEPHGSGASWGQTPDRTKLPNDQKLADYCASIQTAIVDTLMAKITLALKRTSAKGLAIVGGVSANSCLRERLRKEIRVPVFFPDLQYCTDNAAMIGACALFQYKRGEVLTGDALLKANAFASSK